MEPKPANCENVPAPPAILERVVLFLTPRSSRQELLEDLREDYETSPTRARYVKKSAQTLSRLIPGKAVLAFSVSLVSAQAFALCVSFACAPLSWGLVIGLTVGLVVLLLRDGHTYPAETAPEAFLDAFMAVAFMAAALILIVFMSSVPVLATRDIVQGCLSSLATLTLLRIIFRRPAPNGEYGPRQLAEQSYRMACRLNVIWSIAWFGVIWTDAPSPILAVDLLAGFVPVFIVVMGYRSRQAALTPPRKSDAFSSLLGHREKEELIRKRSLLWIPRGIGAEVLFFAVIAGQFATAAIASPSVDWIRFGTNLSASLMLLIVWRYIRKANGASGRLIQAEIDGLGAAEAR